MPSDVRSMSYSRTSSATGTSNRKGPPSLVDLLLNGRIQTQEHCDRSHSKAV